MFAVCSCLGIKKEMRKLKRGASVKVRTLSPDVDIFGGSN